MTANLDAIVGWLCIWIAFCVASIFVFSSTKYRKWINIPDYVRRGFILVTIMFLWRGANLIDLSDSSEIVAGQANVEAVMATIAMSYTITAVSYWITFGVLPTGAWDRLEWIRSIMRRSPGSVAIVVDKTQVAAVAHAVGVSAIGPGEGPDAVPREAPRYIDAVNRKFR